MSKRVKTNSGAHQSCVCSSLAKNCKEVDSSESSSLTSLTTSYSDSEGHSTERDSMFRNNKREDKNYEKMEVKRKLSKRRNPSEMSAKVLKKLESKKSLKKKVQVPKRNKEFLESSYLSDSSDDCDCYLYDMYCDCYPDGRKNKQRNSKNKREKIKSLKTTKASKKSTTKASKKEKTSSFEPYNCNFRDAKCAGTLKSSRVSKKSTRNAKLLSNQKVSRKCTTESSESSSSFSSSEDSECESFSNDKDSRDCCCGNIRQSYRKINYKQ